MSRLKSRAFTDSCADCGAIDVSWASINRGVLICDDCCSIHRRLGRHISQIKSLKKGTWRPSQLSMVQLLNTSGANSIWEHSLLVDPSHSKMGKRKPVAKDPVHPTKSEFIQAKYQSLCYVFRPSKDDLKVDSDISKQLHSSVRTANLETSLRLLSIGADPNYFHLEKGNSPIHVASKCGQGLQIELLVVYGADPMALDFEAKTALDYAKSEGHDDLMEQLVDIQYELTDRLSHYLCNRKPDHLSGQHFLIPEMADSLDLSELAKAAKRKLQALPNHLFDELAMDVFDEIDRRETEDVWLSLQPNPTTPFLLPTHSVVPFLPVNPEFSSPRNQGRQKLARFNAREMATLIIDLLSDAKRRQVGNAMSQIMTPNGDSDNEPLYDSVASDEDYVAIEQQILLAAQRQTQKIHVTPTKQQAPTLKEEVENDSHNNTSDLTSPVSSLSPSLSPSGPVKIEPSTTSSESGIAGLSTGIVPSDKVQNQLAASEAQVHRLIQSNSDMKHEIAVLQTMVRQLMQENADLRNSLHHSGVASLNNVQAPSSNGHDPQLQLADATAANSRTVPSSSTRSPQRPISMYEAREGPRLPLYKTAWSSEQSDTELLNASGPSSLPTQQLPSRADVFALTEQITRCIQALLLAAQEKSHEAYLPRAEDIRAAIVHMVAAFPQGLQDDELRNSLRQLVQGAVRLQGECAVVSSASDTHVTAGSTHSVIQCAYDIAKAAKKIVSQFQ